MSSITSHDSLMQNSAKHCRTLQLHKFTITFVGLYSRIEAAEEQNMSSQNITKHDITKKNTTMRLYKLTNGFTGLSGCTMQSNKEKDRKQKNKTIRNITLH